MAQTFDEQDLLDNVGNDLAFLAETVQMLETDGPSLMKQIHEALAAGDAQALGRAAHTLKGMVANFCSPQTQALALEVEKMGKNDDLSAAPGAVKALDGATEVADRRTDRAAQGEDMIAHPCGRGRTDHSHVPGASTGDVGASCYGGRGR